MIPPCSVLAAVAKTRETLLALSRVVARTKRPLFHTLLLFLILRKTVFETLQFERFSALRRPFLSSSHCCCFTLLSWSPHSPLPFITFLTVVNTTMSSNSSSEVICYLGNGNVASNAVQCDPSRAINTCCPEGNVCLSNGMCFGTQTTGNYFMYTQDACVDQTGKGCVPNCRSQRKCRWNQFSTLPSHLGFHADLDLHVHRV